MLKTGIAVKKKLLLFLFLFEALLLFLAFRVFFIQAFESEFLQTKAYEQQTRDRLIRANRGAIYDRNMVGLAVTESACTVSVIRAQVQNPEYVARVLSEMLDMDYDKVLIKVRKKVALERIKAKVDKETADRLRELDIPGIVIDEDVKRVYPYSELAAQIIGFVGTDNQGIIGLESKYDKYLSGESGKILTETDAGGIAVKDGDIVRVEPVPGDSLVTSLDAVVQEYAEQTLRKVVEQRNAKRGLIIIMNPQNGEIYATANEPTFDLNDPFTINSDELTAVWDLLSSEEQMEHLNQMWRNFALNDTYEPGSTFKIMTSVAGLEEGVVTPASTFNCGGGKLVGDRFIKCWRSPRSHGTQTFTEGLQNSCNPVFMEIGERLGVETFFSYLRLFGFYEKTGVDLPGEAVGIMHKPKNVGPVELATMSFGQSFQITPLQLMRSVSACINGGYMVTPHVGTKIIDSEGNTVEEFVYERGEPVISSETSALMRELLESVVEAGTGNRTYIPGYRVGGKTATSEKLPRRMGKYISSFLAFAPAEEPQVLALIIVDEPQGVYYGGQVAGPPMKELLESVLPYLGVEPIYSEKELEKGCVVSVPELTGLDAAVAKRTLSTLKLEAVIEGSGSKITGQFPNAGEQVNQGTKIILYTE